MVAHLILYEGERLALATLEGKVRDISGRAGSEDFVRSCVAEMLALQVNRDATGVFDPRNSDDDVETDDLESEDEDPDEPISVVEQRGGEIRVRHLVGAARLPNGLLLEILPKVSAGGNDPTTDRQALMRMWQYACDLRLREDETQAASMRLAQLPLHEWLLRRFLDQLKDLLARGLRFQYIELEDNLSAARGRLLVAENLRSNSFAPHKFYCRFEELSPDRPENRLIQSVLLKVIRLSSDDANRRSAAQLADHLHEVPRSSNVSHDFSLWRDDRLMAHYKEIRSTCAWILREQGPAPVNGGEPMFGRFVRMNDVFERYVSRWMKERLENSDYELIEQGSSVDRGRKIKPLCSVGSSGARTIMKPDMLLYRRSAPDRCVAILDAKWKRSNGTALASRSDVYQMYAYASHWLADEQPGDALIALVYPTGGVNKTVSTSADFRFDNLKRVHGLALRFRLPTIVKSVADGADRWEEGLIGDFGNASMSAGYDADYLRMCSLNGAPQRPS